MHHGVQMINYVHIASAMVVELGIDKEANHHVKTAAGALGDLGKDDQIEQERSLEERRIFLGLYWINSV
jgi:hypothetical protein